MFRKTITATVAAAVIATSAFSASTTTASAGSRDRDIAIAVGVGIVAGLLGSNLRNRHHGGHGHGFHRDRRAHAPRLDRECFDKPVKRYDPDTGRKIVVGYRTVCR